MCDQKTKKVLPLISYTPIPSHHKLQQTRTPHTHNRRQKKFSTPEIPSNPTIVFLINPSITSHIISQFVPSILRTPIRSFHQTVYYILIHFPISRGTRERCVCTSSTNPMHFYGIRGTSLLE